MDIEFSDVDVSIDEETINRIISKVERTSAIVQNSHIKFKIETPISSLQQKVTVKIGINFKIESGPRSSSVCSFYNEDRSHCFNLISLKPS